MGKGGEKQSSGANAKTSSDAATKEPVEVLIDGTYYDVKNMKHPGGSVINFYAGKDIDATQAFDNFHIRSVKARKYLKSLPSRKATKQVDSKALLKDFDVLSKQLEAEGFFEPSYAHVLWRLTELAIMHVTGVCLIINGYYYSGVALLGVASGRCGWLMHEGGHYSLTGNITMDRLLQIVFYGVGCGMSASWWRNQHNKHHSMPQKIGHDVDLNTLPLVAFTDKVVKKIGFPMKLWIRFQALMFPIVTCFLVASGWQFFLHPRHIVRTKNWKEALSLVTRYALFYVLFVPTFGVSGTFKLYCLYNTAAADYIFLNFAVSHTHLPTVAKDDTEVDWVQYAAIHTMNCKPGPFNFVNWWMSYLNFQIEHHLFPSMPQFRHPIVSGRVRELLAKHGVKYDQRGYMESLQVTFQNLHKVGYDVFHG